MDNHEWIKKALIKRGSSFAEVARQTGLTPSAVHFVSTGKSRSQKIEATISKITGYTPEELWL